MFRSKAQWALLALIPFAVGLPMADLNSWRPKRVRVAGHPFQVAFSPDGNRVALAWQSNTSAPGRVELWDFAAPSRFRAPGVDRHRAWAVADPSSLCFSGDSQTLVCISYGQSKTVNRWNVATGQKSRVLVSRNGDTARSAHVAPGTGDITFWTGQSVEQRDAKNGQVKKRVELLKPDVYQEDDPGEQLVFSPDGRTTAWDIRDNSGTLVLRDSSSHKKRLAPLIKSSSQSDCTVTALTFSPDSRFLAVGWDANVSDNKGNNFVSSRVALWDLTTNKIIAKWTECNQTIGAHAFSPDGALLAAAREDGAVSLRDAHTGKLHRLLKTAGTSVSSVAFSPDGRTLASCGSDGALYLWRIK
jgi:WD40 repeat protein